MLFKFYHSARFIRDRTTMSLMALSLIGLVWYVPYTWIKSKRKSVVAKFRVKMSGDGYWRLIREKVNAMALQASSTPLRRAVEIAVPPKGPVRGALVHAMLTGLAHSLGPGPWTEDERFQSALKRAFVDNGGRGFSQLELSESREALKQLGVAMAVPTTAVSWRRPSTPTRMAVHEITTLINRSGAEGFTVDRANLVRLVVNALDGPKGSSRDVATLVWGCGKLGVDLREELTPLVGPMAQLSSKDAAMVLWGWAKMASSASSSSSLQDTGEVDEPSSQDSGISRILEELPRIRSSFTGVELANVIWALARLRLFTPMFTTLLVQAADPPPPGDPAAVISPTGMSSITWAAGLARVSSGGEAPPLEVTKGLYHMTISSLHSMDPPCVVSAIWGLGSLGMLHTTGALPYQVVMAIEDSATAFDMDNLKSVLQFTWMDPSVTACLGPEVVYRLASSTQPPTWTRSIPQICLYLSRGALQTAVELAQAMQSYLDRHLTGIAPSSVDAARMVAAFSNLSYLPAASTMAKLRALAEDGASSFYPNTYCMYAIALAQLNQAGYQLPACEEHLTIGQACSLVWAGAVVLIQGIEAIIGRVVATTTKEDERPSLPFARQAIAGLWARGMADEARRLVSMYPAGTLSENPGSSSLHADISQTLRLMGYGSVRDEVEVCGVYRADVVIGDLSIVIECDGDVHYLHSAAAAGNNHILIGSSVIKDKALAQAGWKVVRVSVTAWKNCKDAAAKQAMLRRLLDRSSSSSSRQVGKEMGRTPEQMKSIVNKVVNEAWFDTIDSLRALGPEEWTDLKLPKRLEMALQARLFSTTTTTTINTSRTVQPAAATSQSGSSRQSPSTPASTGDPAQPEFTEVQMMPPATFLQSADNLFDMARKINTGSSAEGDEAGSADTLPLLLQIVDNILAQPSNPKRRRIRLRNQKFSTAVGGCKDAMEFLKSLGFHLYPPQDPQYVACPVVYISRFTDAHYALGGTKASLPNTPGVFNPFVSSIGAAGQVASAPRLTEKGLAEKEAFAKELEQQKLLLKTGGTKPGTMDLNPKVFRQGSATAGMPRIEDVVKELNGRSELLDQDDDFELIKAQLSSIKDSLTSADRAFQSREKKEMDKLKSRTIHTACVIRVAFPDRLVLQLQFRPADTLASLHDAVGKFLSPEYKETEWYLYQTPPMHKIDRSSKRMLADEDLVPSALIRWGFEGLSNGGVSVTEQGPFLDDKMVAAWLEPRSPLYDGPIRRFLIGAPTGARGPCSSRWRDE
ncbi:hypothetical protein FOZ62_004553 [Perkinsus olseni]|uniref:RAP domain-containing protein n=1 Tax=Perkinsus olseni TaxID=32597 RepID=A0A7J6QIX4_PEROL|nr:hypothetical protein FOZ62_004553 [Perkinsus olseni]